MDISIASRLIAAQFPQWRDLPIVPLSPGGWDNKTFRLGEEMLIRMPSAPEYASQVEKEQKWLPKLAPHLPLSIPQLLAMGDPGGGYPFNWSIYRWIEGEPATSPTSEMAASLAEFLLSSSEHRHHRRSCFWLSHQSGPIRLFGSMGILPRATFWCAMESSLR